MQKQRNVLIIIVLMLISISSRQSRYCNAQVEQDNSYLEFEQLVQNEQTVKAIEIGEVLFSGLITKYPKNINLQDLQERLKVASDLTKLIIQGLESRQKEILTNMTKSDVLSNLTPLVKREEGITYLLPPSEQFYWTNLEFFSSEPKILGIPTEESKFLRQYYDLRMQNWIEQVANITTQLVIANPESSDLYPYSLVLPLLYIPESVSSWENLHCLFAIMKPINLDVLVDFCLLRVERPEAAISIAKYQAKSTGRTFSIINWAPAVSTKCVQNHRPDIAEKLLRTAINNISDESKITKLRLKVAEGYAKCGDNMNAAKECWQIVKDFPNTPLYGEVMYSYFAYLAWSLEAKKVLAEIDLILSIPRCRRYRPQLMYIKRWALRKTDQQDLANRISESLIGEYPEHPIVAPVLFVHAINSLSSKRYNQCQELLVKLMRDFPQTNWASLAQRMLSRLNRE